METDSFVRFVTFVVRRQNRNCHEEREGSGAAWPQPKRDGCTAGKAPVPDPKARGVSLIRVHWCSFVVVWIDSEETTNEHQ